MLCIPKLDVKTADTKIVDATTALSMKVDAKKADAKKADAKTADAKPGDATAINSCRKLTPTGDWLNATGELFPFFPCLASFFPCFHHHNSIQICALFDIGV